MDANKKTLSNLVEKLWEKKENKDFTQRSRIRFGRVTVLERMLDEVERD